MWPSARPAAPAGSAIPHPAAAPGRRRPAALRPGAVPPVRPPARPSVRPQAGDPALRRGSIGPTLGALLIQYASWRWIFLVNVPICGMMIVFGARMLRETRDPHADGVPDPIGVLLVAAVPALLSLAIIEGPGRGWSDPLVVGSFALAAALVPVFTARTKRAARPVMDLALFAAKRFSTVNAATLVFSATFYGALLANVLFLQTVWHYSVLRAALAGAPGPLVVALVARPASRLAARVGPRPVLLVGGAVYAVGVASFAPAVGAGPHWATHWLPESLAMGLGIGLTLPVQSGAAVSDLPPARLAIGSAINSSFRQLGAVLGVSVLVAVLGSPASAAGLLTAYRHVWWTMAVLGLASALLVSGLRTPPPAAAAK